MVPRTKYTHKINCWGAFSAKGIVDLYLFYKNLDSNLYFEILEFSLPEMNKIMKNSVIFFRLIMIRNHRSLKALEFYKENNIKIIDWTSNSPDLNPIENIWAKIKNKLCRQEFDNINKLRKRVKKEWDSQTNKNLQIYSNSMNNKIESCLLLNGKITKY